MNTLPTINPVEFVAAVKPLIAANDIGALVSSLDRYYSPTQIASVLAGDNVDGRKVAALCLGLVGRKCALKPLRRALADPDSCVHHMAEHAMWSIWFRIGTEEANSHLARGAMALERREFGCACKHFDRAIALDSEFAEPFNQRAIVHYLREEYDQSIADCREAIERMPCHFGAWAGMGHCQAHAGNVSEAIDCYSQALEINPRLDGIKQAIDELRCSS